MRRRKSLPSELGENGGPNISVTKCGDLPQRSMLVRESVRRFRSLSNRRKTDIDERNKKSCELDSDSSKNPSEFEQLSENTEFEQMSENSEMEQSSENNLPDLIQGNGNGVLFFPVWI